jgi:tetratricopeptide (TPR) repeat protein
MSQEYRIFKIVRVFFLLLTVLPLTPVPASAQYQYQYPQGNWFGNYIVRLVCQGLAFEYLGQWDEALTAFNEALKLDPDNAFLLNNRAIIYEYLKDWPNALRDFTAAQAIDPDEKRFLIYRAWCYLEVQQYERAIKDLTYYLGRTTVSSGKLRDSYSKDWSNDNKAWATYHLGVAYYGLGVACLHKDNLERAATAFSHAFSTEPNFVYAIQGAQAYVKLGEKRLDPDTRAASIAFGKAIALYDKAIGVAGTKPTKDLADAYYNKGVTLEDKYRADESVEDLKQAIDAYTQYLEIAKGVTPPITDAADVSKQIDLLKAKVADF